jgi:hypothetical protein
MTFQDRDEQSGYNVAQLLESYPIENCGCTKTCENCIRYAVALDEYETNDETEMPETPLRFQFL